jgi:ABC-type sugar transport system ATPase subunit
MIGRAPIAPRRAPETVVSGPERLRVEALRSPGRFSAVNFIVRRGEVLGLAGLVGAGRSEIAQAIFGLDPAARGRVVVDGQSLPLGNVAAALAAGVGLVPEDRKRQGLVLELSVRENTALAALPQLTRLGWIDRGRERSLVRRFIAQLGVKTPSTETPVARLSGGNQQKIALAKWLARDSEVLIVDEPTRGVDVGAKAEIHAQLAALAAQGKALVMISSELPELLACCDRILVLRAGRVASEFSRNEFSENAIMAAMTGLTASE